MYELELFKAVDENNVKEVERIIELKKTDLNYMDENDGDGTPLLAHALNYGYARIARLLIAAGADVNLGNNGSVGKKYTAKTPLYSAIICELYAGCPRYEDIIAERKHGDVKASKGLVDLLLQKGANSNALSPVGTSPLQALLYWWDKESVEGSKFCKNLFRMLVKSGANEKSLTDEYNVNKFKTEFKLMEESQAPITFKFDENKNNDSEDSTSKKRRHEGNKQ